MSEFNLNEFENVLDRLIRSLPVELAKINNKIALDAIPRITNRLIDEGKTAEGNSLGSYSKNQLSPIMLIKQASGKGAEDRIKQEQKRNAKNGIKGISYERFRELNNLPTDHVTLSFTGDTLGDIGVLEQSVKGLTINVTVGSRGSKQKNLYDKRGHLTGTKTTEEVLEDLNEKYDRALNTELLNLSEKEISDLQENQDQMLQKLLDQFLE